MAQSAITLETRIYKEIDRIERNLFASLDRHIAKVDQRGMVRFSGRGREGRVRHRAIQTKRKGANAE